MEKTVRGARRFSLRLPHLGGTNSGTSRIPPPDAIAGRRWSLRHRCELRGDLEVGGGAQGLGASHDHSGREPEDQEASGPTDEGMYQNWPVLPVPYDPHRYAGDTVTSGLFHPVPVLGRPD